MNSIFTHKWEMDVRWDPTASRHPTLLSSRPAMKRVRAGSGLAMTRWRSCGDGEDGDRQSVWVCVYGCVWVCERVSVRVWVCVCMSVWAWEFARVWVQECVSVKVCAVDVCKNEMTVQRGCITIATTEKIVASARMEDWGKVTTQSVRSGYALFWMS